ncbi:16481_t:CDS:1 [Funneliformis geosporum]|nr:16481_t:CDS:1 [Funneliformis geosporum]
MMRGNSLTDDLKFIINNPEFSDIEITCEDGIILQGNRAIMRARSEVLYKLLFNGMKESTESKISFPEINSSAMKVVIEYIYTGSVSNVVLANESLENLVSVFHAADYFQLSKLQDDVDVVLLTKYFSKISLDKIKLEDMSLKVLRCFLSQTFNINEPILTNEYNILRFTILKLVHEINQSLVSSFERMIPSEDRIGDDDDKRNHDKVYLKALEILPDVAEN